MVICSAIFRNCAPSCLEKKKVEGKIVLCGRTNGLLPASVSGAIGAIVTTEENDVAFVVPFPATILAQDQFQDLVRYYEATK